VLAGTDDQHWNAFTEIATGGKLVDEGAIELG
jgi:hypothetical protein